MRFEWDGSKNASNLRKHGIRFEEAARVFTDTFAVSISDGEVDGEERWRTTGLLSAQNALVMCILLEQTTLEKRSGLFQRGPRRPERGRTMKKEMVSHTLDTLPPLTDEDRTRLAEVFSRPDSEIDRSDVPELTDVQRRGAKRGRGLFFRPAKPEITAQLDADVLAWLKKDGTEFETHMNEILRREMMASEWRESK